MKLKLFIFSLLSCLFFACNDDNSADIKYFNSTATIKAGTQIILSDNNNIERDTITFEDDATYSARITEHYNFNRTICSLSSLEIKHLDSNYIEGINFTLENKKFKAMVDGHSRYAFYCNRAEATSNKNEYIISITDGREQSWNVKKDEDIVEKQYGVEINGQIVFEIGEEVSRK